MVIYEVFVCIVLWPLLIVWLCIKAFSLVRRKTIIKNFARELAGLHKAADMFYTDPETKTWLIDKEGQIYDLALRLDIAKEVWDEAYKIYDFRRPTKVKVED